MSDGDTEADSDVETRIETETEAETETETETETEAGTGTGTGAGADEEREKTPPSVREEVLDRDGHECQLCGARGPGGGGVVALEVHHKMRDPPVCDRHDPDNLTTLCVDCHSWAHKRPTGDELPLTITDADRRALLPHDYQILHVLRRDGPATTGEVQDALPLDLSAVAVRERLYLMMGLDHEVAPRDEPLIDQDAMTGEWGLPDQIAESARGRIPEDTQLLIRRVHDERVRRALDRGCDRQLVAEAYGISKRTTWHKQRRAQAYEFPLDAFDGPGPGVGGTATAGRTGERDDASGSGDGDRDGGSGAEGRSRSEQLRLDTVSAAADAEAADGEAAGSGSDAGTPSGERTQSHADAGADAPPVTRDAAEGWPRRHTESAGAGEVEAGDERETGALSDGQQADVDALQAELARVIAALHAIDASLDTRTES